MRSTKNIPTLQADEFRQTLMSYDDYSLFEKDNFNDFFIHDLSTPNYKLKLPQPLYRNTAHSVLILTNGKVIKSSGLDVYTISNNSILLVPAGQITTTSEISKEASGYWIHFTDNFINNNTIDISAWLIRPVVHFETNEMENLIFLLKRMENLNSNLENAALIKLYLITFLAEVKRNADFSSHTQFSASERITFEFKRLLSTTVSVEKSVAFYAKELSISPNHLNKSVKSILGKTASLLIDEMILLEAKVLIRQNSLSLSEIAFKIGFEDPSYFSRFFKKHSGCSPTEFKKMIDLSE